MLKEIITQIVQKPDLHARWLNTLSLMENTGARKISASQDSVKVTYLMLKHAAEEARHAFYLKKQILKIDENECPDYSPEYLLAPLASKTYLNSLDIKVCRYLKSTLGIKNSDLRFAAYLLVTYAIEVRADEIYPKYQQVLEKFESKVNVKSIILEEEGHLEEMTNQLEQFSVNWKIYADAACEMETELFKEWIHALSLEINNPSFVDRPVSYMPDRF